MRLENCAAEHRLRAWPLPSPRRGSLQEGFSWEVKAHTVQSPPPGRPRPETLATVSPPPHFDDLFMRRTPPPTLVECKALRGRGCVVLTHLCTHKAGPRAWYRAGLGRMQKCEE